MPRNITGDVCDSCGIAANVLDCLKRFGRPPRRTKVTISTYYAGICAICKKSAAITEQRDFFYPNFDLLLKEMKKFKKANP